MSEGTEWQAYATVNSPGAADTLLVRNLAATPPAAGQVKQATLAALAAPIGAYNVLDPQFSGGADPTGTSDSYAAIQACLDAAAGVRPVYIPAGFYKTSATLLFDAGTPVIGAYRSGLDVFNGTVISATASMPAVLASRGWTASANTSVLEPTRVTGLKVYGNGNATHGIVAQHYDSDFTDLNVADVSGDGIRFDAYGENAITAIASTGVNNRVVSCTFESCGRGFATTDTGSGVYTDGWVDRCVVAVASGTAGISIRSAIGWHVSANHVYGAAEHGIQLGTMYMTRVIGNYVETWGSTATSGTYSAIDGATYPSSDSGVGSVISGNTIYGFSPGGSATSTYKAIAFASASAATASVTIVGNHMSFFDASAYTAAYAIDLANGSSGSTLLAVSTGNNIQYVGGDSFTAGVHQTANGGTLTVGAGS